MALKASRRRQASPPASDKPRAARVPGTSAWLCLITALFGLMFSFGGALHGPFLFDDFHLPFLDPHADQMPARFWIGGVRPLLMATYWANFALSGTNTLSWHIVNLILHFTASLLFFLILRRLGILMAAGPNWSPWFGAGLFLLHPLQTESVNYVAGRSELLCAVFVLLAWLLFLRYFDTQLPASGTIAILLCCGAAVLSKESGVWVAALLVFTDVYWNRQGLAMQFRRKTALYLTGLACLVATVFLILRSLAGSSTAGVGTGVGHWGYALTQCRSILTYLRLFLWPAGQSLDWRLPTFHSIWDDGGWVYVTGLAAVFVAVYFLFPRFKVVSFGLLLFLLALMPTSSFVPLQDNLAERRMYLPLAGLVIAVLGVAGAMRMNAKVRNVAFTLALAAPAFATRSRTRLWSDDLLMWQNVIAQDPGNARAHSWLGGALAVRNDCAGAAREYKSAVALEGITLAGGTNLATAYECSRQPELALATWRQLVKTQPNANAYNRIGYLEAVRNNIQPSLDAFEAALLLDPNNATAYAYRGTANAALRRTAAAKVDFLRAITLDPGNAIATAGMSHLPKEP